MTEMHDETELDNLKTAWVRGPRDVKMGYALLTSERIVFFEQKFMGAAGGTIGVVIGHQLQKRSEEGGPLLEIPLMSVRRVAREKKLMNKDRIALETDAGAFLFNDGWKTWSPLLRQTLVARHRRELVDDGADAFDVR